MSQLVIFNQLVIYACCLYRLQQNRKRMGIYIVISRNEDFKWTTSKSTELKVVEVLSQ